MTKENKQEQAKEADRFAGFKKYYVGGMEVVDLTSIDEKYEPVELRGLDPERQRLYGHEEAWNPKWM